MQNEDLNWLIHVPSALVVLSSEMEPLSASRKGFSVFGVRSHPRSVEEGLGELVEAMTSEAAFLAQLQTARSRVQRPGGEAQFRWERTGRTYEVSVGGMDRMGQLCYVVLFNEVTQQIQFEETRELARRYLEDILNNIQLGVVVLNRELRVTNLNRAQEAFLRRLGTWINWVETIGMPVSELTPDDPKALWEEITERVLVDGKTYEDPRKVYSTPEGDLILSVEITPLKDQRGEMIGAVQVSEDVTEQVRLEEELREAELVAGRLEAVRQTAITVNHEVNNPLTTILATAQILQMSEGDLSDDIRQKLKQVEHDAKRIAEVTKRLRSVEEVKTKEYISKGPKMIDLGLEE